MQIVFVTFPTIFVLAPSVDCAQEVDVVFVIDGSRTIRDNLGMSEQDNWVDIMNFIRIGMSRWPGGVDAIGPSGAQIGIAVFSDDATIEMEFGEHDNYDDFAVSWVTGSVPSYKLRYSVDDVPIRSLRYTGIS